MAKRVGGGGMTKAHKYEYQGELLTVKQLAEIKGLHVSYMRNLIRDLGIDEAMAYVRKPYVRELETFDYRGQKLNINQLIDIAQVKCAPNSMRNRIKKHGVVFAVEHNDWEALRRKAYTNRKPRSMKMPDLPEHDPEKHMLENMVNSLQEQGMPLSDIYSEVRRRLTA